jgi:hypothetical protein
MDVLRQGSRGFKVAYLHALLDKAKLQGQPVFYNLGDEFGPQTHAGVQAFQRRQRMSDNGVVMPQTWRALGHRIEREHNHVIRYGQRTQDDCWSAAATSILGNQCVGQGRAKLGLSGHGLRPTLRNLETFAHGLGWRMLPYNPTIMQLASLVQQTPLWVACGSHPSSHAVVLSGVYSDGTEDATVFRVHDPWPAGGPGRVYGVQWFPAYRYLEADGVNQWEVKDLVVLAPSSRR